jgi:glutamate 5-kinase
MDKEILNRIQNSQTIVIKVGSARVSGDRKIVNDFLYNLAGEIRRLRDQGKKVILVSSGAIAQGKSVYQENFNEPIGSKPSLAEKQALAAMGQNRLMNLYEDFFSQVNIPIAQILFGKGDIQTKSGHKNLENTFQKLLDWDILPIINENDSISTEELNLGDNDLLSAMVASFVHADLLLILTGVDGFLKDGKLIPYLSKVTEDDFKYALGPIGPGTGGMNTKLRAAKILLNFGVITGILNGTNPHSLQKFFSGSPIGTLIGDPNIEKPKEREDWIERFFHE